MIDCLMIVVSYRSAHALAALMRTMEGSVDGLSWHCIIVNNDPAEAVPETVEAHPHVSVVEAGENLGYGGGINLGLAAGRPSRWTIFLNPDLRLSPGALATLARAAGDRTAAVPTIVDDDGVIQHSLRREPSLLGSLGDAFLGGHWPARPVALGETVLRDGGYVESCTVDWATGAVLLVPTRFVRAVGQWDAERFFLYSEETDYCRRLREVGCPVRFVPQARVIHQGAGSGTSEALHALQELNRVRYFRKWHGIPASTAFAGVVLLNNLLRARRPGSRAAVRALLDPRARRMLPGGVR